MSSWVQLQMKCPHCNGGSQSYWTHSGCGSYLYINANARVECSKDHGNPFWYWRWKCSSGHGYEKAYSMYVKASLGVLVNQLIKSGNTNDAITVSKAITQILLNM